jgi:hypothetical protein
MTSKATAARPGMTSEGIAAGLTDELQQLDCILFRVLKAQEKRSFQASFHADPYGRRAKQEVVAEMITARSILETLVIEGAWDICIVKD